MLGTMRLGHPENSPSESSACLIRNDHHPAISDQHCFVDRVESGNSTFEGTILSRPQLGSQRERASQMEDAPCDLRPICGNQIHFLNGQ